MNSANNPKRGRPVFLVTPLSLFTDTDAIIPYDDEICYDDKGTGSIGRIKYKDTGVWEFVSESKAITDLLDQLKNTGVIDNASSGLISKELTYFLFDNTNPASKTVHFNKNLVYPHTYKYYAIRDGIGYITGIVDGNGAVITNIVSMGGYLLNSGGVPVPMGSTPSSNQIVMKPNPGFILPNKTINDGDKYIVEFYDESKRLIDRDVFHAEYMLYYAGGDIGDGISELLVTPSSTTPIGDAKLFRGASINDITFMVMAKYSGGQVVDVTNTLESKLTIRVGSSNAGIDTINTSTITGDNPFSLTFTYNPDGNNPIPKTIKLHVVDDLTMPEPISITPIYFTPNTNSSTTISKKYWTTDGNGNSYEVTSAKISDNTPLTIVNNQTLPVTSNFKLGVMGTIDKIVNFVFTGKTSTHKHVIAMGGASNIYGEISTVSGKFKIDGISDFANFAKVSINGIEKVPTHFDVYTLPYGTISSKLIANGLSIGSAGSGFDLNTAIATVEMASKNIPLLVQFYKPGDNGSKFVTKLYVCHLK